ncbi:hypothetical protein ACQKIC_16145 [Peribacillus sp. NPDC046944]|uniref:hypothetical protein n=1 Tax=unclassified Peribacillus TaxID=2675266 RepID=UPI003D035D5D
MKIEMPEWKHYFVDLYFKRVEILLNTDNAMEVCEIPYEKYMHSFKENPDIIEFECLKGNISKNLLKTLFVSKTHCLIGTMVDGKQIILISFCENLKNDSELCFLRFKIFDICLKEICVP